MKHIEKHPETPEVQEYIKELKTQHLDEAGILNSAEYADWTGSQLYEKVRELETLPALKQQLFREQGGVCCYCGMKLEYPFDPQYRLEHVRPKDKHRELVGEYKNLLLSCRANMEETELRSTSDKKNRKKYIHCDEAKGAEELNYSPLDNSCETAFTYTLDGKVSYKDQLAEKDIITLGLNGPYLTSRRKNAIESLFIDDDLLSEEYLKAFKDGLQKKDANGNYREFYFVLIDAINQLLPAV